MTTAPSHPLTDHLWQLGFTLKTKVDRLPVPIVAEDEAFYSNFTVTAYPERGEARRHFSRKGPLAVEVKSNVLLEVFGAEQDRDETTLKDTYTETCARHLLEILSTEQPALTPAPSGAAA